MASFITISFLWVVFGILTSAVVNSNSTCYSAESCLYDNLMSNYNKHVRPATSPGTGVDVTIDVALLSLLGLEEKNEVLETMLKVNVQWTDTYLTWDTNTYPIQEILLDVELLWLPDIAVTNSVENFIQTSFLQDFRADITSTGSVSWVFGGIFKTSCSMDISHYPFDSQSCNIELSNLLYKDKYVNLTAGSFITNMANTNSLWEITSSSVTRSDLPIEDSNDNLPVMTFTLNLRRKTGYYIFNIVVPIVMLCVGTLGVFWLPPDCGEKISLGITILLAFSVFQIVIMDTTPVNSEETPYISKLVTYLMIFSTISLLTSMLSVHIFFKPSTSRVPRWLRFVAFKGLAKAYLLKHAIPTSPKETSAVSPSGDTKMNMVDADDEKGGLKTAFGPKPGKGDISELVTEVKKLTAHLEEQKESDFITDEWKLLAVIVDRTLFLISIVIIIIMVASSTNF